MNSSSIYLMPGSRWSYHTEQYRGSRSSILVLHCDEKASTSTPIMSFGSFLSFKSRISKSCLWLIFETVLWKYISLIHQEPYFKRRKAQRKNWVWWLFFHTYPSNSRLTTLFLSPLISLHLIPMLSVSFLIGRIFLHFFPLWLPKLQWPSSSIQCSCRACSESIICFNRQVKHLAMGCSNVLNSRVSSCLCS